MKRSIWIGSFLIVGFVGFEAHAFMEEGGNGRPIFRNGFTRCRVVGDLREAEYYGCNPWMDDDANFSFESRSDQEKSSVHYNMTSALAIGAGFSPCAAYVLGLYDQATDAATEMDQMFWAPFPPGVTVEQCGELFVEMAVIPTGGLDGPGAYVMPDFTFRGESADTNEIARESMTFHFNPGLDDFSETGGQVVCASDDGDPEPQPDRDVVPLSALYAWASSDTNPFNVCHYGGPIVNYDPEEDVQPGSLGAFGVFLHTYQDTFSHRDIIDGDHFTHSDRNMRTSDVRGFVTSHYAGEFGLTPDGNLGQGVDSDLVIVTTPAGRFRVILHSQDTYDALVATFDRMVGWLHDPEAPERLMRYGREQVTSCSREDIELFAYDFARIPNYVAGDVWVSGARRRAELANSFFDRGDCSWAQLY